MSSEHAEDRQAGGFVERIARGLVRVDGSMGFMLARHGVPRDESFDAVNLHDPHRVRAVHQRYIEQGQVDLIETNTFSANRIHMQDFDRGYEHLISEINRRGVEIARQAAAGTGVMVGGAIGPITHSGLGRREVPSFDAAQIREAYLEQIVALGEAGVDCFIIETIHRYGEGIAALEIARERFPGIPVVFQVACASRRAQTFYGDDVETLIRAADERGADVIGLNCFLDPAEMYPMMLEVREWTRRPLAAQPNVGRRSTLCEGVYKTDQSLRTTLSVFSRKLVEAGVRFIGGCCGIMPEHIAMMRDDLRRIKPAEVEAARARHHERYEWVRSLIQPGGQARSQPAARSKLEAAVKGGARPVLIEIDPPRVGASDLERTLAGAARMAARGVGFFTVADNPGREPRLGRDVFAGMLRARLPQESELVLHAACADKTLVAFASEMETMQHLAPNVLVISGDPPTGEYALSSAPYDLRSVKALRAYSMRNQGLSVTGEASLEPTGYYVGGAFNPRAVRPQIQKFATKALHAGASFAMTQPIFDVETLEETAEAFATLRDRVRSEQGRHLALFPGVMQITTARNARILRKGFGMPVPKGLLRELAELDGRGQRARGREVAAEVLRAIHARPEVFDGVYVIPQFHAYEQTAALLAETGWL